MSEDTAILHGSCLCGGIRYRIRGPIGEMSHCHCSMCRKAHGAAFGTYAPVAFDAFEITAGAELVGRYRSSAQVTRTFCTRCGSTLQFVKDDRPGFGLAVATLDDDPGTRPVLQIFTRDHAPWFEPTEPPPLHETEP